MNALDVFLEHESQSLHSCYTFSNGENFNQLGDMMLMLVNFEYVVSIFLNGVDHVSENFLCNINVHTIRNEMIRF